MELLGREMAADLMKGQAYVYLLKLRSGRYYVGACTDLVARLIEHQAGTACRTTKIDPPTAVLWLEPHTQFSSARKREAHRVFIEAVGRKLGVAVTIEE